jgi:chromosome segregation ATPase
MITITKFSGRAASAFVVPVIAAGALMGSMTPAVATTSPTTVICNGVTNQEAHCGGVQPNLLKAAARQNAAQIATLTAERAALVTTQNSLTAQITAAEKEIAALDAGLATLEGKIATTEMSLTKLTSDRAALDARIATAKTELTELQGQKTMLASQITPLQDQLSAARGELAALKTQKANVESSLVTKRVSPRLRQPVWTARPPRRPPLRTR